MKTRVLLDTDIGTDVDDAICLAYLLAQEKCELLGITTEAGRPDVRAGLASVICRAANRRVPIYAGSGRPIKITQPYQVVPQAGVLEKWPHDKNFIPGQAVEFMAETIRRYPGEVILIGIGPLTNIGELFQSYPDVPCLLKSVVLMAGNFSVPQKPEYPEYNTAGDPEAAGIVYSAAVPLIRTLGLEITIQVGLEADDFKQRFDPLRNTLFRPVFDFADIWINIQKCGAVMFHDPMTAATVFENNICSFERGRVSVDFGKKETAGKTHWQKDPSGHHEIAITVDKEKFFENYFKVFL